MSDIAYPAIYDFALLPYALGDVLTWNVQTAIRAERLGFGRSDIYICLDPRQPSNVYQRDMIKAENSELFFNELFGAFGTHPSLGNIFIHRSRSSLLDHLRYTTAGAEAALNAVKDYETAVSQSNDDDALRSYFMKYVHSHEQINNFAAEYGRIPLLRASRGCEPDITRLRSVLFSKHRIVVVHPRLRRLDAGYAGENSYHRDSDFIEWYEFLRVAGERRPDVRFIVLGRIHEKPLQILRLPNVISLRSLGLGLGHELTLMLEADLFIGTSSGFAAFANFTKTPYYITRMSAEACATYAIPQGDVRLPFSTPTQHLVYGEESASSLAKMLDEGLEPRTTVPTDIAADIPKEPVTFAAALRPDNGAALASRFRVDQDYVDDETFYLVWPRIQEAMLAFEHGDSELGLRLSERIAKNFPRMSRRFPWLQKDFAHDSSDYVSSSKFRDILNSLSSIIKLGYRKS